MPTPVPPPTATELVTAAEIAMVTVDVMRDAIAADSDQDISNAKWTATLVDITRWNSGVSSDAGDVKRVDTIEFFEGSAESARLDLRNAIRIRYGLGYLTSEAAAGCGVEMKSLQWF